jgi:hypothetical protein
MTLAAAFIRKLGTVPFFWALVLALVSAPALAKEVLRDDEGTSLEVSGFFKTQLTGILLHPDSMETLRAQARLFERAQAEAPPGVTLPSVRVPPPVGLLDTHVLRLGARFKAADIFELDVAWQLGLTLASDAAYLGVARTEGDPRRLVPLGGELGSGSIWRISHELDRFAIKIPLSFGDLTLGRQVLSWGTGRFWNPTDVLSPFPPTAVDREVRRGFDAARLAIALGEVTQLDLIYLPREKPWEMGGVVRFQTNLFGFDGSLSVGKYIDDLVFGADLVGDLGPIGVHAEGAYTLQLASLGSGSVSVGEHFFRGVIGAEAKPHEKLLLMLEYGFNGYGTARASRYATVLASDRVRRGEIFGAGKHQLAFAGAFLASDIFSAQLAVLSNVSDPSFLIVPSFEWSVTQWLLLRGGASIPLGATQDASVFDALGPIDVFTQSEAFNSAVQSRGLRSEFGASAFSVFLQVGAYVP